MCAKWSKFSFIVNSIGNSVVLSQENFFLAAAVNLIDFGNLKIFIALENEMALAPHHTTLQTKCLCPCSRHKRP